MLTGLDPLCCPGKVQDLLSQVLQLIGDRDSSPSDMTTGPVFSSASVLLGEKASLSSPCLHMADEGLGYGSHTHYFGAGSPRPVPTGLALLCCPAEVQHLLPQVLQLVRNRKSSPFLMSTEPALAYAPGNDSWWGRRVTLPHLGCLTTNK